MKWLADALIFAGLVLLVVVAFLVSIILGLAVLGVALIFVGLVVMFAFGGERAWRS